MFLRREQHVGAALPPAPERRARGLRHDFVRFPPRGSSAEVARRCDPAATSSSLPDRNLRRFAPRSEPSPHRRRRRVPRRGRNPRGHCHSRYRSERSQDSRDRKVALFRWRAPGDERLWYGDGQSGTWKRRDEEPADAGSDGSAPDETVGDYLPGFQTHLRPTTALKLRKT